ncbi:MAG TPA: RagB/SusD family nutrient uptake outer membrane protein, partial [Prolixibacteraceae bacterium]
MNRIYLLLATLMLLAGCSESFLDTQNLTKKSSDNFPGTAVEADQAVTGIYSILPTMGGLASPLLISEILSDDRFGGGGQNDRDPQAIEFFRVKVPNEFSTTWNQCYKGIFRANTLLSTLNKVDWKTAAPRQKAFGEASFLRAYYYFDLARLFGQVPLVTDPTPANNPKASADSLFAQIGLDLKHAIDSLPADPLSTGWKAANMGRATKWAAEGMMARVFLFYTGYYKKTEMTLADGGKITKDQVIGWVDDCVANSGAALVSDFRNMWPYALKDSTKYG